LVQSAMHQCWKQTTRQNYNVPIMYNKAATSHTV